MVHDSAKMSHGPLRVAMIVPPWLALPIQGYGGIELVVQALAHQLTELGVEVTLFANGEWTLPGVKTYSLYKKELYPHIFLPLNDSVFILNAHLQFAINHIMEDGNYDIIHNHMEFVGTQVLNMTSMIKGFPPVVHTHHGPPFTENKDEPAPDEFWEQLSERVGRFYIVGISEALLAPAPEKLRSHILPAVHNAIELEQFPYVAEKQKYFCTLARFNKEKSQHIAARICARNGYRLRMAGTIAGIGSNRKLLFELANPLSPFRGMEDFKYYSDSILPYTLRYPKITYSGNVQGRSKMKFISEAKALLFPIQWDEPFGMAVIEALACGTPVIAMNRGAMPEIIQHGVNGFLAENEEEFETYMNRVDEIDPAACRASVKERFTAKNMARQYLERYQQVIELVKQGEKDG